MKPLREPMWWEADNFFADHDEDEGGDRPDCGHSACIQNWIDTGEGDCVFEDEEDDDA